MCLNGSKQEKGIDYDESYSPTGQYVSIRICIALATALDLRIYALYVDNAFQCTPKVDNQEDPPTFITMPPLYLQWFQDRFPKIKLKGTGPFVLQMLNFMQGNRKAGRAFHILIKAILGQIGLSPTSVDKAVFVWIYKEDYIVILVSKTDDFLILTNSPECFNIINKGIKRAFGVSLQQGDAIYYLNTRIIQSSHGISFDQCDHIIDTVSKYFDINTKIVKTDTPLRADLDFDKEVYLSVPATASELKSLVEEFKGSYSKIYGEVMHIMVVSRPDLSFALHRLGVFQPGPNRLGFQRLHRVLKYLRCHPNVPLFYPRQKLTASNLYQLHHSDGTKGATITIPNFLCGHVDASWKPFRGFGHSISGHLENTLSVAVD